ncbi:MAG: hypothetical protein ACXWD8_17455 [Mycobacterium sp.]
MTDTAVAPPPPPPINVAFLGRDMGQSKRARLPFVRDDDGRVGWSSQDSAWFPAAAATGETAASK